MEPGVDIVITNYRTPGDLERCLDSLDAHWPDTPITVYVMQVDPNPEDVVVSGEWVADHPHQAVHRVRTTNVGYARACNFGAFLGDREVIGLFNADVEFTAGVIDECHAALFKEESWAVLGPRQVDGHGRLTSAGIFGTLGQPAHRDFHRRDRGQHIDIRDDAVSVMGSAYFVKRAVWDELTTCPLYQAVAPDAEGAFLPTQHYYEETYCSYHAQAHGYKIVYFGPATMIHRWHRASPLGGSADKLMGESKKFFREACELHQIPHD